MTRYALVDENGLVVNVILWDGESPYLPPSGTSAVPADPSVGPGWTLEGGEWVAPPEPEPEPDSELERKLAAVEELKSTLGISDETARVMVGLPPASEGDDPPLEE